MMGLNRMYLRDANVALIVYDVTKPATLTAAEVWIEELKNTAPSELLICLCGNKVDAPTPHAVPLTEGQNFAKNNSMPVFFEVSAKSKENLDKIFNRLSMECFNRKDTFPVNRRESIRLRANPNGHLSEVPE